MGWCGGRGGCGSPSPGTFKQAMNFLFSMIHLCDGSHSMIRGSCRKSFACEDFIVLLSLSFGCCTESSLLMLISSVELSFLLFSLVSFLTPPFSSVTCSSLGFVSSWCSEFSTPDCAVEPSPFVSTGSVSALSWIQRENVSH